MGSKFGIILAFLLSIAAGGGSYYLYQGWVEERNVRGSVEAKYDQAKEKMLAIQSEKEQYKTQTLELKDKTEAIQGQLDRVQAAQKAVQDRLKTEKESFDKQMADRQIAIDELQKKVESLKKEAEDARQSCKVTPADMKTDFLTAPGTQPTTPASASGVPAPGTTKLVFETKTPDAVSVSLSAPEVPYKTPPIGSVLMPSSTSAPVAPVVTPSAARDMSSGGARILTVNRKFNFVVINLGLQDGLKMADQLKVLKQGKDSATIQVEKLYDKFSAASILEEQPAQQIAEGDEIRKV